MNIKCDTCLCVLNISINIYKATLKITNIRLFLNMFYNTFDFDFTVPLFHTIVSSFGDNKKTIQFILNIESVANISEMTNKYYVTIL